MVKEYLIKLGRKYSIFSKHGTLRWIYQALHGYRKNQDNITGGGRVRWRSRVGGHEEKTYPISEGNTITILKRYLLHSWVSQ